MTRDDLKEGMIIEERDGGRYRIKNNKTLFLNNEEVYGTLDDYNDALADSEGYSKLDVVKVYDARGFLLWDREMGEKEKETIMEAKENPIKFIKNYFGVELTQWQEECLTKMLNEYKGE